MVVQYVETFRGVQVDQNPNSQEIPHWHSVAFLVNWKSAKGNGITESEALQQNQIDFHRMSVVKPVEIKQTFVDSRKYTPRMKGQSLDNGQPICPSIRYIQPVS